MHNVGTAHWTGWASRRYSPEPFSSSEIAAMVANNGLAALYDTSVASSVTLNGTRASALADLTGLGRNVTQVTAGMQPLYTGGPVYGPTNWPALQFTIAREDRLFLASTDLITTNPCTFITVHRYRTVTGGVNELHFGNGTTTTGISLGHASTGARDVVAALVALRTDGTTPTTPEVWAVTDVVSVATTLTVGDVSQVLAPASGGRNAPGAGGAIHIGGRAAGAETGDMDFLFGAIFTAVNASLNSSIVRRLMARLGQ